MNYILSGHASSPLGSQEASNAAEYVIEATRSFACLIHLRNKYTKDCVSKDRTTCASKDPPKPYYSKVKPLNPLTLKTLLNPLILKSSPS